MKSLDGERRRPLPAGGVWGAIKAAALLLLMWPPAASASVWNGAAQGSGDQHRGASRPVGRSVPLGAPHAPAAARDAYERPYRPHYGRWSPGQVLPPDAGAVVVTDYERFHLRRPPQGYAWVSCDGDFILAASATGLIFEVIPGAAE